MFLKGRFYEEKNYCLCAKPDGQEIILEQSTSTQQLQIFQVIINEKHYETDNSSDSISCVGQHYTSESTDSGGK